MTGDPRLDDLKRLERDFATAMEQLYAVGNGLARLRHDVEEATSPTAPPQPVTQPPVAVTSPPPAPPIPQMPPVPGLGQPMPPMTSTPMMPPAAPWEHPAAWPPREPTNALSRWWRNESVITRVLGVAGAIVTLAGLVMLLVLAVQQQWFGPVPRVVLGALLALTLIGLSLRLRHRERAAGRSGHAALALAATGYAAAYLVVVAVTATYGWLPPVAGLALALLVVGSGLVIARRWDSQFLAVLLLLGAGLMVPSLVDHSSWVLSAFMVVLALGSWPVQLGRTWPWATLARVLPAALVVVVGALANQFHPAEPWAHVGVTTVLALGGLLLATLGRGHVVPATAIAEVAATATPLLVSLALTPMPWRTVLFLLAGVAFLGYAALGESQRWLPVGLTVPATGVGTLALDMVSLVPCATFRGRPHGLRADLAQVVADLRPRFLRFPGGCLVHGEGLGNMYRWQDTVGPRHTRRAQPNLWNYHQSGGLGYYEYFQFCEDIGAVPLPIVPAGVCCPNTEAKYTGAWEQGSVGCRWRRCRPTSRRCST